MFDLRALGLEKQFRKLGTYVYAINQSRAAVLFDPIYLQVASRLLKGSRPSPKLMEQKYAENLYLPYREKSRKLQYWVEDWDFSQARPDLLTERQREMMHTVALGETSGSAVADGFLRAFRTIPDLGAFFGTWFVEELNHFIGYHYYLERMGERWPEQRGLEVAQVEFRPYSKDPMEVAAANMYQELLGYLVYRSFGKQVKDPFLARMLSQFAKDELRHYKYYQQVVARHIQQNPDFRKQVLRVTLKATSPFNQVSGGTQKVIDHLQKGAFWFRKAEFDFFMDQLDFLLGADLREFFGFFFRGLLPPCEHCQQELYQCGCAAYEHGPLAPPAPAKVAVASVPPPHAFRLERQPRARA